MDRLQRLQNNLARRLTGSTVSKCYCLKVASLCKERNLQGTENARKDKVESARKGNCKEWNLEGNGICKELNLQGV